MTGVTKSQSWTKNGTTYLTSRYSTLSAASQRPEPSALRTARRRKTGSQRTPTVGVLWLPLFLLLAVLGALGSGLWLAALNVEYRDVRYVVPFFVQIWLFVTPVIYPTSRLSAKLTELGLPVWLSGLNPMTGVVEGFRWALLGSGHGPGSILVASASVTFVILLSGAFYFRRMERTFADVV